MNQITTAVLPVAGLGTRVMPLTIHQPKAMIGIVDRPMIHYVIDEMIAAGIKRIILVVGSNQPQFKQYVDYWQGRHEWGDINFKFVIQSKPIGNGDAIYVARRQLANKPFVAGFSDDLLVYEPSPTAALVKFFQKVRAPILVLEAVPKNEVSRYGVVAIKKSATHKELYEITDIVEKPKAEEAPSNLTVIGRYILTPVVLSYIKKLYGHTNDIGLADALKLYIQNGGRVYGWRFPGQRFDCGSKIGLLKAQAYFASRHPELQKEFRQYLAKLSNG